MQWTTAHGFIGCRSLFELGSVTLNECHDIGVASDVVELFFAESGHFEFSTEYGQRILKNP